jgi:hypothetical protein
MYSAQHFPVPLDGTSFDELVQRVRELTTSRSPCVELAKLDPTELGPLNRWAAC